MIYYKLSNTRINPDQDQFCDGVWALLYNENSERVHYCDLSEKQRQYYINRIRDVKEKRFTNCFGCLP